MIEEGIKQLLCVDSIDIKYQIKKEIIIAVRV